MPTVIAFANQKGGVGKTTLSTQFAFHLALRKEKKVLFIDMDAQGSATESLLQEAPYTGTESQMLFRDELEKLETQETPFGIRLIGSLQSPDAYDVEAMPLQRVLNPKKHLSGLMEDYDYVVIDCPPSLGRRLAGALMTADFLVCPIKLSGYAVSGLTSLFGIIFEMKKNLNPKLRVLGIAVNEFRDNAVQRHALTAVEEALPGLVFKNKIRTRSPVDLASSGKPIFRVRNGVKAASEMNALFEEILNRIDEEPDGASIEEAHHE